MQLESRGVDLQRRSLLRRAAWVTLAPFAAWILYLTFVSNPLAGSLGVLTLILSFTAALWGAATLLRLRLYTAITLPTAARRPARVSVEENGLTVSHAAGIRRWPLSEVVEGWAEAFEDECDVMLRTRRDDLVAVRVSSPEEGAALLRAVGVSADKQVVRFRLAEDSASSSAVGCIALVVGLVLPFALVGLGVKLWLGLAALLAGGALDSSHAIAASLFVGSLVGAFKLLQAMIPPIATVGVDGIEVRGFGSRRFISLENIARVESTELGVLLRMRDGSRVTLTTLRKTPDGAQGHAATRAALLRRIDDAFAARGASQSLVARAAVLERQGRSFDRWRAELAALAKQDANYRRNAGLARDDLQRVLEDASAPAEHRVGAVVALIAAGDVGIRARVRIAAAACADEELRAALEAAAEQELDEPRLERALRRVQHR